MPSARELGGKTLLLRPDSRSLPMVASPPCLVAADVQARPAASGSPREVTFVAETLRSRFVEELPEKLIGDRAYDSGGLDEELADQGIEMIAPSRCNRKKTQHGRKLRRFKRR